MRIPTKAELKDPNVLGAFATVAFVIFIQFGYAGPWALLTGPATCAFFVLCLHLQGALK